MADSFPINAENGENDTMNQNQNDESSQNERGKKCCKLLLLVFLLVYLALIGLRLTVMVSLTTYNTSCVLIFEHASLIDCSQEGDFAQPDVWILVWVLSSVASSICFLNGIWIAEKYRFVKCNDVTKALWRGSFVSFSILAFLTFGYYAWQLSTIGSNGGITISSLIWAIVIWFVVWRLNYTHQIRWYAEKCPHPNCNHENCFRNCPHKDCHHTNPRSARCDLRSCKTARCPHGNSPCPHPSCPSLTCSDINCPHVMCPRTNCRFDCPHDHPAESTEEDNCPHDHPEEDICPYKQSLDNSSHQNHPYAKFKYYFNIFVRKPFRRMSTRCLHEDCPHSSRSPTMPLLLDDNAVITRRLFFLTYWLSLITYCTETLAKLFVVSIDIAYESAQAIVSPLSLQKSVIGYNIIMSIFRLAFHTRLFLFFLDKIFHGDRDLFSEPYAKLEGGQMTSYAQPANENRSMPTRGEVARTGETSQSNTPQAGVPCLKEKASETPTSSHHFSMSNKQKLNCT